MEEVTEEYHHHLIQDCSAYIDHWHNLLQPNDSGNPHNSMNTSFAAQQEKYIRDILRTYLVPSVCIFGIVGNILNLIVLTREQLIRTMKHMERSANSGLVSLAVSDLMFCLLYLLRNYIKELAYYSPLNYKIVLYYFVYYEGFINTFLFSSTWLTVIMALSRHIAVCHPLQARWLINMKGSCIAIVTIFLVAILVNLPRYFKKYVTHFPCQKYTKFQNITFTESTDPDKYCNCYLHQMKESEYYLNEIERIYDSIWAVVAVFIPIIILVFCTIRLIHSLRESRMLQELHVSSRQARLNSGHRITPILIILVILFVAMVSPAEILQFLKQKMEILQCRPENCFVFWTACEITNFLSLINFTLNFVLYCAMNRHFRRVFGSNILCIEQEYRLHHFGHVMRIKSYQLSLVRRQRPSDDQPRRYLNHLRDQNRYDIHVLPEKRHKPEN